MVAARGPAVTLPFAGVARDSGASAVAIGRRTLTSDSRSRIEWRDVSAPVRDVVRALRITEGMALVNTQHTTAALVVAEYSAPVLADLLALMDRLVPDRCGYRHDDPRVSDCERGNGSAHLRAALMGRSVTLAVSDGELALGPRQSIVFLELDGPRRREISVQVVGWSPP